MRRIVIEYGRNEWGGTHINVIDEYGRETGALCFGEMLEQVAGMVAAEVKLRSPEPYPMLTPQQWEERERRRQQRRLERNAEVAA